MRITISINDDELIEHINSLRANNLNVSKFFNDAATDYIKEEDTKEKQHLKDLIREVLQEEGFDFINPINKTDEVDNKSKLKERLNIMFSDIENK